MILYGGDPVELVKKRMSMVRVAHPLIEFHIKNGHFAWKYAPADLSLNDFGRLCEIGLLTSLFCINEEDLL